MEKSTLVKADKELVRQAHELGANIKKLVDLMLEDYIRRNKCLKPETRAGKRPTRQCNGGTIVEDDLSKEVKSDSSKIDRCGRGPAWLGLRPSKPVARVRIPPAAPFRLHD